MGKSYKSWLETIALALSGKTIAYVTIKGTVIILNKKEFDLIKNGKQK